MTRQWSGIIAGTKRQRNGPSGFYHPELDTLRFCAFLMVYFSHALPTISLPYQHLGLSRGVAAAVAGFMLSGRYGVDVFFALSSYLITELLLREYHMRRSIDVKAFYIRRILRIWPLYFSFLFLGPFVLHAILPQQPLLDQRFLLSFVFLMGNWSRAWWNFPASAVGPLWSVSIEEQFYLVWPIVMNRWIRHIRPIACGLIVCAFIARGYYVFILRDLDPKTIWFNTFCRLDPIAAGILLASFLKGESPRLHTGARLVLIVGGLTLITACCIYLDNPGISAIASYPIAAISSVMMIAGTLRPMSGMQPKGFTRGLVYLGRISYGLYVFHSAALDLTSVPSGSVVRWSLNLVESLGLTIFLAVGSYRFLEEPFLKLKSRFSYVRSTPDTSSGPGTATCATFGSNPGPICLSPAAQEENTCLISRRCFAGVSR